MLDTITTRDPGPKFNNQSFVLSKTISAIQVGPDGRLRPISQLPDGAEVHVCGGGFNDRTVKVRWHQSLYFVFAEDLAYESQAMAAAC